MGTSYYIREVTSRRKKTPDAKYVYITASEYNPSTGRTSVRNVVSLGRKRELDTRTIRRLVQQLNQYLGDEPMALGSDIDASSARLLGPVALYRGLWEKAGFGELFRQQFEDRRHGHRAPSSPASTGSTRSRICPSCRA